MILKFLKKYMFVLIGLTLLSIAGISVIAWTFCRIYVPEGMCAVLIKRTGDLLPEGESVATQPGQRGIQQQVLGPGRHFRDPIRWDWKIVELTEIPAGDPATWKLTAGNLSRESRTALSSGQYIFEGDFPQIGVVTRKVGKRPPMGQIVVPRDSDYQGILAEVLTPGAYKLNPYVYEIETYPATIIPAGFVGVVTNLFDAAIDPASAAVLPTSGPNELTGSDYRSPGANSSQRGTMRNVLQPGLYFINPKLQKVTLVEIGFNEYSQLRMADGSDEQISFPSDTGYLIRVGVTVVWGIDPDHAAEIVDNFGNVDKVLEKVIVPQLRSICRNIGSTYSARDFIQGEKREQFQRDMTEELRRVCKAKNVEVLLALVRDIEVHAPAATGDSGEVTEDLKRTIQQSFIAIESQITKEKQREAATVKAQLEEEIKKVDIARETIKADTRIMVANIHAEGEKTAAEIAASAELAVADVQQQVAELEANRVRILGQAKADVERMKNESEAQGYAMLVNAFGSAKAYNLFTFAENFEPESIRLFYSGEGTFWTDLSRFEQVGAAKLLKPDKAKVGAVTPVSNR